MIRFSCPLTEIIDHLNGRITGLPEFVMHIASSLDGHTEGWYGVTEFADDGTIRVFINSAIPFDRMPEIIAHEFAHVLAGQAHEHDDTWQGAFDAMLQHVADALGTEVPEPEAAPPDYESMPGYGLCLRCLYLVTPPTAGSPCDTCKHLLSGRTESRWRPEGEATA